MKYCDEEAVGKKAPITLVMMDMNIIYQLDMKINM